MGKAEISITSHSLEDIEAIVTEFAFGPSKGANVVQSFRKLFGGYSASNYLVNSTDSEVAVLKIMNGYGKEWVEGQTALQDRLRVAGFHGVCHCLPLRTAPKEFVTMTGGTPACLLTFCEGSNAATLLEEGKVEANRVLDGVGRGLAALHSVKIDDTECGAPPKLRTWREGGACLVVNHFRGDVLAKMQACEHTAEHDYVVNFYPPRSTDLQRLMSEASGLLPHGCLHGDPFLDNVLCLPSGDFSAFVDLEDISTGPLLFDVACCAIGSCFDEKSNALDLNRLQALLQGYTSIRRLSDNERQQMVEFMRLALLCNCTWRFVNFNIDNRSEELIPQREAYVELQERIVQLERPEIIKSIETLLSVS